MRESHAQCMRVGSSAVLHVKCNTYGEKLFSLTDACYELFYICSGSKCFWKLNPFCEINVQYFKLDFSYFIRAN